jgi:hypothetical protein
MLLDKTLDFEKRRQKLPFILFAQKKNSSRQLISPHYYYHTFSQLFLP